MSGRLHVTGWSEWAQGVTGTLPEGAARHVQVWRSQPGDQVQLFDGHGECWTAEVVSMGRREVVVRLLQPAPVQSELPIEVTLALGMPANDRMDFLVEKASELGVRRIQPLVCARSVLRLDGERAQKKVAHWQAVASAACEQSGRLLVPEVAPVMGLKAYLAQSASFAGEGDGAVACAMLSPRASVSFGGWAQAAQAAQTRRWTFLSGPEGGLSPEEEQEAAAAGWSGVRLGPRILRADTAPLAVMAMLGMLHER